MAKFYLLKRFCVLLFLVSVSLAASAQNAVTGKVTLKDDGTSAPGVNVLENGTSNGTTTDANGDFSLTVGANATLTFSFIGYKTIEVLVGTQTKIDVSMESDVTSLSEVVVVGYGLQEKKDVTGSIVAVGTKDLNKGIVTSPQDMMLGKVAGVQITSDGGAPGAGSSIRIRGANSVTGSNDPLIVVDGFPLDNTTIGGVSNGLASINPNDIETFTVLKDASATAIYGLRATNGVIIITTKKGKEGKKMEITYNGNVSASVPVKYLDVMTGDQYRAAINEQLPKGVSGLDASAVALLGTANTDWQRQIFHTSVTQDHNLGVSGAYKTIPYRVSYGYTDTEGLLKTTNLIRNSVNVNLTPTFLDGDLAVSVSFKGSRTTQNFSDQGAIGAATVFDPTQVPRDGNTRWGGYFTETALSDVLPSGKQDPNGDANTVAPANPLALLYQTDNRSKVLRGIGTLKLEYRLRFFPAIKLTANAGFDYADSKGHNNATNNSAFTATNNGGRKLDYTNNNKSRLLDLYANYSKQINQHKFDVTVGYSYQAFERFSSTLTRNGQTPPVYTKSEDVFDKNGVGVPDPDNPGKVLQQPYHEIPYYNYLLSFFGRLNYSYADKYLFTASFRDDASSRFSKANRFVYFPSAAVGWRINKEDFMANVTAINDLKLRGSYGITGNQDIYVDPTQDPSYPYLALYKQSSSTAQYQFGNGFINTQRPQAYDAKIKWETTAQANVGFDFALINNRISGSFDVYQKKTKDLINRIPVPLGSNFSNFITTNVGNLENKGIEFALRGVAIQKKDVEWTIGFNVAHNENKITKLLKSPDSNYPGVPTGNISGGVGTQIQVDQVGHPINAFSVFQQVYGTDGRPLEGVYLDKTGNGGDVTLNSLNKYILRKPTPNLMMGLNSRFAYKHFDLYVSGRVSIGNYAYNNNQSSRDFYNNVYSKGTFFNLTNAVHNTDFVKPQYYSSYYLQNASFFKMDNMSLGYNFNRIADFTQQLKGRIAFTVNNAFFITKYKGLDPDVANNGIDNNIYPRPRVFMVSLNLTY